MSSVTRRTSLGCDSLLPCIFRHAIGTGGARAMVAVRILASLCQVGSTDDSGQDLIEYALLAALLAVGAMAAVASFGDMVDVAWRILGSDLTTALGVGG